MVTCLIDGKEFKNGGVLARHLKEHHQLFYKEYYHKYILKTDDIPQCKCGCKESTRWNGMFYTNFVRGHHNRVHNNWGHNPKAIAKSAETRRKQFASGERVMWTKGLTAETDSRLATYGKKVSASYTPKRRKEYAERMSMMRRLEIIPILKGKNHPNWQGGISTLQQMARSDVRLYHLWKYPILEKAGFKCEWCPKTGRLQVHHNKETFSEIIKKVLTEDDYKNINDFAIKRDIVDRIIKYHVDNNVSGQVLCKGCHSELHPSLNFEH